MNAKSILFALSLTAATVSVNANADGELCKANSIVAFGASLTLGMPTAYHLSWVYSTLINTQEMAAWLINGKLPTDTYRGNPLLRRGSDSYGRSPIEFLANHVGGAKINWLAKYYAGDVSDYGVAQVEALLHGKNKAAFDAADIIVGLDAFYWDASYDCGPVAASIENLVQAAQAKNKTLILGNIPYENSYDVRVSSGRLGMEGRWYAPNPVCADYINAALVSSCTTDRGCHIIDLNSMVNDLDCGVGLKTEDGVAHTLYQMRPDGVHLSDAGSRYVGELMVKSLKQHSSRCN